MTKTTPTPTLTEFMMLGITCITFNSGRTDPSHGVWASDRGLTIMDAGECGLAGSCAKFNESAESRISLPYFSNAMPQFSKFSISFWLLRMGDDSYYSCDLLEWKRIVKS